MNIYEKMAAITTELGTVAKNLEIAVNKSSRYKAVSERDIIDAVKPLEAKYGVYSYPVSRKIAENEILIKENTYNGNTTKTNSLYLRIETVYRFVNVEKPEEYIETTVYGDGIDTGDKAPGKAMTYADKYALKKAYKISTGDDPDREASPEQGYGMPSFVPATPKVEVPVVEDARELTPEEKLEALKPLYSGEKLANLLKKYEIASMDELPEGSVVALYAKCKAAGCIR